MGLVQGRDQRGQALLIAHGYVALWCPPSNSGSTQLLQDLGRQERRAAMEPACETAGPRTKPLLKFPCDILPQ